MKNKMIRYLKIISSLYFLSAYCLLKGVPWNIITISREIDGEDSTYGRLSEEGIYLVFAQLACCFLDLKKDENTITDLFKKDPWKKIPVKYREKLKNIISKNPIQDLKVPAIIVFNEAFFGQNSPLEKNHEDINVDKIISIYNEFLEYIKNAYLYINFLYKDKNLEGEYNAQIDISKKRYKEIIENESKSIIEKRKDEITLKQEIVFLSFFMTTSSDENGGSETFKYKNKYGNDRAIYAYTGERQCKLESWISGPSEDAVLLFNQTKIFCNGQEIGYYNKSSFCNELDNFVNQNLYYVIGDFKTYYNNKEEMFRLPYCLTCYDIDVITNNYCRSKIEENKMKDRILAFSSNSTTSFPGAVINLHKNEISLSDHFYICADSYEEEDAPNIINEEIAYSQEICLNGIFKYEKKNLSLHRVYNENCSLFTLEYITSSTGNVERKNVFTMRVFPLVDM